MCVTPQSGCHAFLKVLVADLKGGPLSPHWPSGPFRLDFWNPFS